MADAVLPPLMLRWLGDPASAIAANAAVMASLEETAGAAGTSAGAIKAADAETAASGAASAEARAAAARAASAAQAQEAAEIRTWNQDSKAAFADVSTAIVAIGATLAIAGGASLDMAATFQSATTRLITSAGETRDNIGLVGKGMLDMSSEVGIGAIELDKAMYVVDSAQIHGADSLIVLRAAAEGAKTENADLKVVADAVTTSLVDYHLHASDAATVTSKLVAAVGSGKTTFQELTGALHNVAPVASAVGISINDVLGDLASMTIHGMSADQATQNLTDTIRHMVNPTAQQAKELSLLGLTTTQLAGDLKSKGLSGTLGEISDRIRNLMPPGSDKVILDLKTALDGLSPSVRTLGQHLFDGSMSLKDYSKAAAALDPISAKQATSFATLAGSTHRIGDQQMTGAAVMQNYTQALAKATGDATGLNVALMLTGENAGTTSAAVNAVSGATTEAGGHVKGWSEIQSTFNQQLSQLKAGLEEAAIKFGTRLLPVATQFVSMLAAHIPAIIAFGNKVLDIGFAVGSFASKLGPLLPILGTALGLFIAWQTAMTIGTAIGAVATAVSAFGEALVVLSGSEGIAAAAQWVLNVAMDANPIGLVILGIAALIVGIVLVATHWKQIASWLGGAWHATITAAGAGFSWLGTQVHNFTSGAGSAIGGFFSGLGSAVHGALTAIGNFAGSVAGAIGGFFGMLASKVEAGWSAFASRPAYWIGYVIAYVPVKLAMLLIQFLTWLGHIEDLAGKWGLQMIGKAASAVGGFISAIMTELPKLPGQIWGELVAILNFVDSWASQQYDKAVSAVTGFIGAIMSELPQLPGQVWGVLSDMLNRLDSWASDMGQRGMSAAQSLGSNLLNEAGRLPGQMADIGTQIVQGVWNGIQGMSGWITSQVYGFFKGLAKGAKDAVGIKSPSALFAAEIGLPIAQGIAVGLAQGIPEVQGAMTGLLNPRSGGGVMAGISVAGSTAQAGSAAPVIRLDDTNDILAAQHEVLIDIRNLLQQRERFPRTAYGRASA